MDVTLMAPPAKAAPTDGARAPTGRTGGKPAKGEGGFAGHLFAELASGPSTEARAVPWGLPTKAPSGPGAATDAPTDAAGLEAGDPTGAASIDALLDFSLAGAAGLQGLALLRPQTPGVAPNLFAGGRLPGATAQAFAFVGAQPLHLEGLTGALPAAATPEALAERLAAAMAAGAKPSGAEGKGAGLLADTVALSGAGADAVTGADDALTLDPLTLDAATALDLGPEAGESAARLSGGAPQAPAAPVAPTLALQRGETLGSRLPPGVDEQSVLRQISDTLALKRGRQRTEINLNPAELGRVKVRMELENGVMRVVLRAEHAATHDLLGRSLDQLRRDLMAQGVQIGHLEVRQQVDDERRGRRGTRDDDDDLLFAAGEGIEVDESASRVHERSHRRRHEGDVDLEA